jgi:hypothetical protein
MVRKDLHYLNQTMLSQIIGVNSTALIKRDDIYKDIEIVNGFKYNDKIVNNIKTMHCSNYKKNILDYLEYLITSNKLNLNVKNIKKWSNDYFKMFKDVTHQHVWYYRINLYNNNCIHIQDKKPREKTLQDWGFSNKDSSINNYLNNIPNLMAAKALDIFHKTDFHEIYSMIHSCESIYDVQDLSDLIFNENSLLNKLFNIEEVKGSGKGEALVTFLLKGKTLGSAFRYDIHLDNGNRIEIKSTHLPFRFGTKASIGNYEFYRIIIQARDTISLLIKQFGKEAFKSLVSYNFYSLSLQIIQEGDYTKELAISTAIDSAEVNRERIDLIRLWFFLAHVETYNFDHSYTIKQDVFTKKYEVQDNDPTKLINTLRHLKYVINPSQLLEDVNIETKKCFDGIDYLIIFKEKEKKISICTSADQIMMYSISQNGIKFIERTENKPDTMLESLYIWSENKEQNYYDIYRNLKNKIDNVTVKCLAQ